MSLSSRTVPTTRHLIGVLLAVALLVAGLAAPAVARATTTEVSATMTLVELGEADREWESGPMEHGRGIPVAWALDGDVTGEVDLVHNATANQATGDGTGSGTIAIDTEDVTWEGRYRGKYTAGLFAGTFVAHGDDGTLMRGTIAVTELEPVPVADLEATILERPER